MESNIAASADLDVGLPVDFAAVASAMLELDVIVGEGNLEADVRDEWAAKFDELQKMLEFVDERQRESQDRNAELARKLRDEVLSLEQARLRNLELSETADAADEERKRVSNELSSIEALVSNSQSNANELQVREKEALEDVAQMHRDNQATVIPALAALAKSVADTKEEMSLADSQTEHLGVVRGDMRRKIERVAGDKKNLAATLESLRMEDAKLAVEPNRLSTQMEGVDGLLSSSKANVDKIQASLAARDRDMDAQKLTLASVEDLRKDLERKTARHRADVDQKDAEVANLEHTLRTEKMNFKGILERKIEMRTEEDASRAASRNAQTLLEEANAGYERAKRELRMKLDRCAEVSDVITQTASSVNELEINKRAQEEEIKFLKSKAKALKFEMEALLVQYLQQEGIEKRHRTALSDVSEACAALETDKEAWSREENLIIKQIAVLKVQRDNKSRELETTVAARRAETEKGKMKAIELNDVSKQIADAAAQSSQFTTLYEVAKSERNSYSTAIQQSKQSTAEMRERLKILRNEVDILHVETAAKDKALEKEQQSYAAASSTRDQLRATSNKSSQVYAERQLQVEQQILEIDKLSSIIDGLERDMHRLKLQYEAAVEVRSYTGIQLIDRNDELCVLYEKSNIHEKTAAQGERAFQDLNAEVRTLNVALKELDRQQNIARMKLPDTPMWAERILELQNALTAARGVSDKLCAKLETPSTAQRWIALEGEDPDTEQLELRASELEQTLSVLKKELLDRELSLEELRGLSERLSTELHGAPDVKDGQSAASLGKQINELQQKIRETTRRLMALVSEVSMYQAEAMKLTNEVDAGQKILVDAEIKLEKGQPPSIAAEQRWSLFERMRAGPSTVENKQDLPSGPEPRPNAYIPDGLGAVGVPKPFGKNAPFKPTELGQMRHYHAPVQKPLDL